MPTYRVEVRQEYHYTVEVEAETPEAAERIALQGFPHYDELDHTDIEWSSASFDAEAVKVGDGWAYLPPF